jgi:hypothetical protein
MRKSSSPWEEDGDDSFRNIGASDLDREYAQGRPTRGTLGQFIERSTSAPPASGFLLSDPNCSSNNDLLIDSVSANQFSKHNREKNSLL